MKDLTPQKKVKEWVQNIPPTRAATSDAIIIISSDEDSNASPAGNLSEAGIQKLAFPLGWQGNEETLLKCLSIPPAFLIPEEPGEFLRIPMAFFLILFLILDQDPPKSCDLKLITI